MKHFIPKIDLKNAEMLSYFLSFFLEAKNQAWISYILDKPSAIGTGNLT